jgi:hypothetical protein
MKLMPASASTGNGGNCQNMLCQSIDEQQSGSVHQMALVHASFGRIGTISSPQMCAKPPEFPELS